MSVPATRASVESDPLAAPALPATAGSLLAGRLAFEAGRLDEAASAFERVLHEPESQAEAMLWLGRVSMHRGETQSAMSRFAAALEIDPTLPAASVELARMLVSAGRTEEALDTLWLAVHHHPHEQAAWLELGKLMSRSGKLDEARECLERCLVLDAASTAAFIELGRTFQKMHRYADAVRMYRAALELSLCDPQVHNDLANCLVYLQRNEEAVELFHGLVRKYPHSQVPRLGYGNVLQQLGRFDEALEQYQLILKREALNCYAQWNRALILLLRQQFNEGWACYENRLLTLADTHPRLFPFPRWRGSPLDGKSLLVYSEQGIGDEIMFASCLDDVITQAGRCVVECSPKLAPLFARSFPRATVLPPRNVGCRAGWGRWATSTSRWLREVSRATSGARWKASRAALSSGPIPRRSSAGPAGLRS